MNFQIRIPIAVAIDYGPILFHALEPLVALIHIIAATRRAAQAVCNNRGVTPRTPPGGLLALHKLAQPRGVVGQSAAQAHIATLIVGVDVGIIVGGREVFVEYGTG